MGELVSETTVCDLDKPSFLQPPHIHNLNTFPDELASYGWRGTFFILFFRAAHKHKKNFEREARTSTVLPVAFLNPCLSCRTSRAPAPQPTPDTHTHAHAHRTRRSITMSGAGRKSAYRKSVTEEVLNSFPEPDVAAGERVAQVVQSRGGNILQVHGCAMSVEG